MNKSMHFSEFETEPFTVLEGYITRYTPLDSSCNGSNMSSQQCVNDICNNMNILINYNKSSLLPLNNSYVDLSNSIGTYKLSNHNVSDYDLIDNCGNLLFVSNLNFKETIPKLKDSVLEDTNDLKNYHNKIYSITGIGILSLLLCFVFISK